MNRTIFSILLVFTLGIWFTGCATAPKEAPEVVEKAPPPPPAPVDPDNDGIVGVQDGCPNKAEDKDGYLDKDGCPDPDNDSDGILDAMDKCPVVAEDVDGFQDHDGCPELDNDGDGIADADDGAPNDPETFNQFQDGDGIPDIVPAGILLEGANFASASAELKKGTINNLDTVGSVLKQHSTLRIRIEGYTDSNGSAKANQKLSESRAKSVKDYIVSRYSISPGRLLVVGYGEERPIADNNTAEGRERNRRVEIIPINDIIK